MSRFKKIAASSLTAVALAATAVTAPTATAADADSWQENVNPDFQPGEAGGSSTGSSQLDLTLIITAAAAGVAALASAVALYSPCLLYTSPSPRDRQKSRMPSSA